MKYLYFTFFILLLFPEVFSQGDASISGRIFDKSSMAPLPFASVAVTQNSDDRIITGALTDANGRFLLTGLSQGEYFVNCSFIGYGAKKIHVLIGRLNNSFDLGKIELEPEAAALGEVVISDKRDLVSTIADKKSFDIANNISQSGGSVLDVMRNLPGITIDQEGKVELRGSDKVTVLIDGKQSSLTGYGNQKGLSTIPAMNIESIEIINNPSAKYDAVGMAGIINIIYKKETRGGLNGDIGFTFGLGELSRRKPDLPTQLGSYTLNPKYIPSLNLNYRKEKFNIFFQSEVLNQRRLPNNEFTTRIYDNGDITASQVPENRKQTQYILKGGVDYKMNSDNILTVAAIYDYESHHDTAQVPYLSMPSSQRYRYWSWLEYEITGFMNYSLSYRHKFPEPGHELNANIQYTKGWEDESYHLNDSSSLRISDDFTHILATEHTTSFTLDYIKPLKRGRLEAGTKIQIRRLPVTYTVERGLQSIIYPGLGDWSDWGEDNFAGYLNWILEAKKIDVEAGIRAEETKVFYDLDEANIYYPRNDSYDYFNIYPNIRVTYKINKNNSVSAYFNRRIDRPGEPELRVFPKYDDPELLKVGNPYLRPQLSNSLELSYKLRWNSGSVSLAGYFKSIKDPYTRIYSIDTTSTDYNIVNKIYQNVGSAANKGIELIVSQDITKFWKATASCNWYMNTIREYTGTLLFPYERDFVIPETTDVSADLKLNNQFTLPWKTQFQLTALYYTPKNIPQGKQMARSSVDLGLKKTLFSGKGEIAFSFSDIFNDFGIKQEITGDGFTAVYENFYETQIITIGLKYKF
jgi:outer membrane receptor protein involved in Fe transport